MILAAAILATQLAQLRSGRSVTISGEPICSQRAVVTFYARRGDQRAWGAASIASLLHAISRAGEEGLDPSDYHLDALPATSGDDRELLATDAFLLFAQHLTEGRVDPQSLIREWCIPAKRTDLAAALQSALDTDDIEGVLQNLAPRHPGYLRLRAALQTYRDIERSGGWPLLSEGPTLRLGASGARVLELRRRLACEPFIDDGLKPVSTSDAFDEQLERLVRHFQSHHGLEPDGLVGRATRRELNVPASERVQQIALNMERWRWMPERLGDSYVLVNIAGFRLDVVENSHSVLSMKTIVGKNFWETPFFPATMTEIVLNPSWFVPDNIADEELWPKQRRDPSYLRRNHFEFRNGALRQLPGPWNPLGRIKFNMPNRFSVYLHDTPAKSLFSLDTRAFSHGCIRLERPFDLALYLLRGQPEWNFASLGGAINADRERTIRLANPEPVYLLYWTAWAADDGHIDFHRDVYNRDAELREALVSAVTIGT